MAVFSAQPVIEIAPEFAAERALKVAPATMLDLSVARVRMALQSEAGPARSALEARLAGPDGAARSRVTEAFGLSATAIDLLDLACALAADPRLGEAHSAAQGAAQRVCPTENLARRLFGHADRSDEPVWRAGMPLAVWGLLVPIARVAGEPDAFEADPRIVDWLRGVVGFDAALVGRARRTEAQPPLAAWPVAAPARDAVRATDSGNPARVVVAAAPGSGRATFAAAVAAALNRRALAVDPAGIEDVPDLLMRARRLARLANLILVWRHHDGLQLRAHPAAAPLEFVTTGPRGRIAPIDGTTDLAVPLPGPDRDERRKLWRRLIAVAATWPSASVDALSSRPGIVTGDIVAVARSAPSGPSGTGKTMAAEAIADRLGADLLIVDLAATVSKYIGETAKNLSRVFDEAAGAGCILLFDEADALFAKRTEIKDSHDRHANTDTNHLLQLLEGFDGLAILATNRRANMDPAFVRRIRHVVEFARPAAAERRIIWRRAIAALAGESRAAELASLLDALADQHELTAAQIKNAMLTARYAAMREGGPIRSEEHTS